MRLGFWGVGLPVQDAGDLALLAARLGYHGVDVRVGPPTGDGRGAAASGTATIGLDATDEQVATTRRAFSDAGVEVAGLLSYNRSPAEDDDGAWDGFEREIARHLDLARRLGAPAIRFMVEGVGGSAPDRARLERAWERVGRALDDVSGVTARIQNHAGRAGLEQLVVVAEAVDDPRVGIELSPDHTVVMQEDAVDLVARAGRRIHKVCWADRVLVADELARFDGVHYHVRYRSAWLGEGSVRIGEILDALVATGYDGYLAMKWEAGSAAGTSRTAIDALAGFPGLMRGFDSVRGRIEPSAILR